MRRATNEASAATAKNNAAAPPPIARPSEAEAEEVALELAGDVGIGGADEMQHLDDLARARHRAAGGEADRRAHRDDHQGEQGGGEDDDRARHHVEARQPHAVVVKACRRRPGRERGAQRLEVVGDGRAACGR